MIDVFILNHFYSKSCNEKLGLTSVVKYQCSEVNDYNEIVKRFDMCKRGGNIPTFIGIDFIEHGDNGGALKAIKHANSFSGGGTHIHSSILTDDHSLWYINLEKIVIYLAGIATFGIGLAIHRCYSTVKIPKLKTD